MMSVPPLRERESSTLLDAPLFIRRQLDELLPAFNERVADAARATSLSMAAAHEALRSRDDILVEAMRLLLTHVANDWVDLLYDLSHGRGRAALRTSRSLFEHQLAAEAVAVDEVLARRYVDHRVIGDRYFLGLHRIEQHLEGNELKAYRHRLKKIDRDTAKEEARVIATYGSGFRRSWAAADIYSLAASAGHAEDYAFYRVASLPTHGAAAGVFGSRRTIDGGDVYRTGPSLAQSALSAIYGPVFTKSALVAANSVVGSGALDSWRKSVNDLIAETGRYVSVLNALDQELWPEERTINTAPMVVVGTYHDGELWLAMPDRHLAFPYEGEYGISEAQNNAQRVLIERVLVNLKVERVGILLLDAQGVDYRRVRFREGRPLDEVITSAPFSIDGSGAIGVPSDFEPEPFLDDLLGRHR